jgi:DNA-directed RNA polymerase specialized sigma24 family protein
LFRRHRRLTHYLRALLPDASETETAFDETVRRILDPAKAFPAKGAATWADGIAREVATERRKAARTLPFSDALFRQLADAAGSALDEVEGRHRALAETLPQLPPPERELLRRRYELGLTAAQIAASEGRPAAMVLRELAGLHESLANAVLARGSPAPLGGAADLGRLCFQLLDGTIGDDSRLVLETLLLADTPAQAHYLRYVALVTDLIWHYRGPPPLPKVESPAPVPGLSRKEWVVTAVFVAACAVAIVFIVLLFGGVFG